MEKITTDIYSFENLRKGGYVYVDKTDLLWRLAVDREGRQFFISRPRRFGRSARRAMPTNQYKGDRRPVTLVGVNFRTAKRNIDEPLFAKF